MSALAFLFSPVTLLLGLCLYVGYRRLIDGPDPHYQTFDDLYWASWPHHLDASEDPAQLQ